MATTAADIKKLVSPLYLIFGGALICFIYFYTYVIEGSFKYLEAIVGMPAITIGVFWLSAVNVSGCCRKIMLFVKVVSVLSCIMAVYEHFFFHVPLPVDFGVVLTGMLLIDVAWLVAVVLFCVAMRRLSSEAGLEWSARSWKVTILLSVIIYAIPIGLCHIATTIADAVRARVDLDFGVVSLILTSVLLAPMIHFFVSVSRMKKEAALSDESVQDNTTLDGGPADQLNKDRQMQPNPIRVMRSVVAAMLVPGCSMMYLAVTMADTGVYEHYLYGTVAALVVVWLAVNIFMTSRKLLLALNACVSLLIVSFLVAMGAWEDIAGMWPLMLLLIVPALSFWECLAGKSKGSGNTSEQKALPIVGAKFWGDKLSIPARGFITALCLAGAGGIAYGGSIIADSIVTGTSDSWLWCTNLAVSGIVLLVLAGLINASSLIGATVRIVRHKRMIWWWPVSVLAMLASLYGGWVALDL